jgi:glutathione S-transferase
MQILYGSEPSFYTRKAWASMRLLGLEVDDRLKSFAVKAEVEAAVDGYHRFPVVQTDAGDWLTDSTRIGLELSRRHPARSLVPDDPALAAVMRVTEDWFDEWMVRYVLAWRPLDPETRAWVARVGALNLFGLRAGAEPPAELADRLERTAAGVERFFVSAGAANGVSLETVGSVRAGLDSILAALEVALSRSPFLLGGRPSLADAALWGHLDAGLLWEPAARAHVGPRAPALRAFHARLAALADSGGEPLGTWEPLEAVAERLAPLLGGQAQGFVPFLVANARALADGSGTVLLDGAPAPARGFTDQSRRAVADVIRALPPAARARFDAACGGWPLIDTILDTGTEPQP